MRNIYIQKEACIALMATFPVAPLNKAVIDFAPSTFSNRPISFFNVKRFITNWNTEYRVSVSVHENHVLLQCVRAQIICGI